MNDSFAISSSEPKLNETIQTSFGTGRSSVITMAPGNYPISLALPAGSSIEQASCSPSDSNIDTMTLSGTINIAAGVDAVCTISTTSSATETVQQVSSFIESRARLIQQHQPSMTRRRERLSGRVTNDGGISGFGINISDAAIPFNASIGLGNAKFSYSFLKAQAASLARSAAALAPALTLAENSNNYSTFELGSPSSTFEADTQRLIDADQQINPDRLTASKYAQSGQADQNITAPLALSDAEQIVKLAQRFDFWVEGEYTNTYSSTGDGHFAILHVGADYLVNSKVLLGLGLQADWMEQEGSGSSSIEGRGFLIVPYTTVKLSENLFIDARIVWGKFYNKGSPYGTYTDKFNSERLLASAALAGDFDWNEFKIEPEVRLSYYKETSSSYIDSLNVVIPSVEVITGTMDFGPQISRSFKIENGMMFTTFTSIKGIWTFEQENTSTNLPGRTTASSEGVRARAEAGFRLSSSNGLDVSLSGNYDGIGDDNLETWGTTAKVRKTF